jgi:hypothetical protein
MDNNGKAGYTGAPGEQTCAGGGCHNGGSSASKGVTITAVPSFSNNEYYPDSTYNVSVIVAATSFTRFGFACEALNSSNASSGSMASPGTGVKIVNAFNGRQNATHTAPKSAPSNQATFTFKWTAPSAGEGDITFYTCCNAVNYNGNILGDLPIPYSYLISEGTPPAPTNTTGITENIAALRDVAVFPNPTSDFSNISYSLVQTKQITVELAEISGKQVKVFSNKTQYPGNHSEILDIRGIAKGAYFIKVTSHNEKLSQKMLIVN